MTGCGRRAALVLTATLVASALGGAPARAGCGGPNCTDVEFDQGGRVTIQVRSVDGRFAGWPLDMISPGSRSLPSLVFASSPAELGIFRPRQRFVFQLRDPFRRFGNYLPFIELPGRGTLTRREGPTSWRMFWSFAAEQDPERFFTGIDRTTNQIVFFDRAPRCLLFICGEPIPVRPDLELLLELRPDSEPPTTPTPVTVTPVQSVVDDFTFTWGASTDDPVPPNTGIRSYVWSLDTGLQRQTNDEQTASRAVRLTGLIRFAGSHRFCVGATDIAGNRGQAGCVDLFLGQVGTEIHIFSASGTVCSGATTQFYVFLRGGIREGQASQVAGLRFADLPGQTVRLVVRAVRSSADPRTLPALASGTTAPAVDGRPTVITTPVSFGPGLVDVWAIFDGTPNYRESAAATLVEVKAGSGPTAPTGVVVTPSRSSFNSFSASWSAATSDCGSISYYRYSVDGEDDALNFATGQCDATACNFTVTEFTVRGAVTAGRHTFRVRAVDDSGNAGSYSVPVPFELTDSASPAYVVDVGAVGTVSPGSGTGAGTGPSGPAGAGLDLRAQFSADIPLVPR